MKAIPKQMTEIISEIWENQSDYELIYASDIVMMNGADFAITMANYYMNWYYMYTDFPIGGDDPHTATEYESFYMLWTNYIDNNLENFRRLYQALHQAYNAAFTDDYMETYNENKADTFEHGKVATTSFDHFNTKSTYNSNVEDQVTTDTGDSYRNDTKQLRGGYDDVEQTGSTSLTNSGVDTHRVMRDEMYNRKTVTGRRGNVADQILSEIDLRTDADLTDFIIKGFVERHLFILNEMGCHNGT